MPHLHANGINIYYEQYGQGYPLVLISGLGGDRTFWQPSIDILSRHFKLVIYDTRGIGRSDAPEAPYSMQMFADDLAGLMDGLNISHAHVLGFSMGGNIALQFALKYPQKISKLILAATCATLNIQIKLYVDAVLSVYEGGISTGAMFNLVAPWLFSERFLSLPGNEAYLQFDENDPEQQPLYAWRIQYQAQREFNVIPKLSNIAHKPLILTGEHDVFAQMNDAKILSDGIPGSELKVIAGAGHLFNYEYPELFHECISEFLKK